MTRTPLLIGLALLALAALSIGATGSVTLPTDDTAGALGGERPDRIETVPNTTNHLSPDERVQQRNYASADIDVGSAVAASADRLKSDHRSRTVEEQLTSQPASGGERLAVAEQALADAEARMERLDSDHEALFRAYSNGSLTRQAFVGRLARLDARAAAYGEYLDDLERSTEQHVSGDLPANFDTRLSALRTRTVALPDPLAERTRRAVTGDTDPFVLYAEGVGDTLVLGAVDDGQFYRQATLRSSYRSGETDTLGIEGALQRATELYPWVYSGGQGFRPQIGIASAGLYKVQATHPHGTLTSYISGSTSDVFHESQTLDPDAVPVYGTVSNQTEVLNLSVTTTTQTGPMRVELTTPGGAAVNGTVLVDGQRVDTTGEDGELWTVRPSGTFEMTVVGENGDEISLSPIRFLRSS